MALLPKSTPAGRHCCFIFFPHFLPAGTFFSGRPGGIKPKGSARPGSGSSACTHECVENLYGHCARRSLNFRPPTPFVNEGVPSHEKEVLVDPKNQNHGVASEAGIPATSFACGSRTRHAASKAVWRR